VSAVIIRAIYRTNITQSAYYVYLAFKQSIENENEYEELRGFVFENYCIPIYAIEKSIDKYITSDKDISLGSGLKETYISRQGIAGGLYPRVVVDSNTMYVLDSVSEDKISENDIIVSKTKCDTVIVLKKNSYQDQTTGHSIKNNKVFSFSTTQLLLCVSSIFGWSFIVVKLFRVNRVGLVYSGAVGVLFCSSAIALLYSIATVFQINLHINAIREIGVVLFIAAMIIGVKNRTKKDAEFQIDQFLGVPWLEAIVFLGVFVFVFLRMALFPVSGWDGRFVWMFLANEIFTHGFLSMQDMLNPAFYFTNQYQPLLLPGWMAFFSNGFPGFNERMAMSGVSLLYVALLVCNWMYINRMVGRVIAMFFFVYVFVVTLPLTEQCFADPLAGLTISLSILSFMYLANTTKFIDRSSVERSLDHICFIVSTFMSLMIKFEIVIYVISLPVAYYLYKKISTNSSLNFRYVNYKWYMFALLLGFVYRIWVFLQKIPSNLSDKTFYGQISQIYNLIPQFPSELYSYIFLKDSWFGLNFVMADSFAAYILSLLVISFFSYSLRLSRSIKLIFDFDKLYFLLIICASLIVDYIISVMIQPGTTIVSAVHGSERWSMSSSIVICVLTCYLINNIKKNLRMDE
jgi:hypothetical protein